MGLSNDTPLAGLWTRGRALRFVDGPDEVHLRVVSRDELAKAKARGAAPAAWLTPPDPARSEP
jgi:acyl-CoA dehydrogenase